MHVRRTHGKRTHNTFQHVFKSQNKSLLRKLRFTIIGICILLIIGFIIYTIYSLRQNEIYNQSSNSKYQSPLQSFMDPNVKIPKNSNLKQQSIKTQWKQQNDVDLSLSLSKLIMDNLYSEKVKPTELQTSYINEYNINSDLIPYTQLSWEEECESSTLKPKHYYDSIIDENKIDFVFPENDKELYQLFHSEQFLNHWDTSFLDDNYWNIISALDSDSEKDIKYIKTKYIKYNNNNNNNKNNNNKNKNKNNINKYFDFNGLTSDLTLFNKNTKSIGLNGNYWYTSNSCIEHKSCEVYPIHRVLSKSKIISCKEILTNILPLIYKCINQKGKKCENIIDSGYFRMIMKTYYEKLDEEIVIKMMKPRSIKKERDYIRHIRESILLGHLYELENKYISNENNHENNNIFTQSLNNGKSKKKRAFNFVQEYGHCVTPLWISISPLYKMALDKWISKGYAKQSKLSKLIFMSLQIAYSVELLHTIPGGPFHHTDIQPRQFLLDDNDNIYINDFNRGKFQPYYFNNNKIIKCWYCGHRSRGHWRAPEEPKKRPLNEKLDIFSMGLTIWALYSNDAPFRDATFDELTYIYYDLRRIPPMTDNMPPAIKDIILSCLKWDPRQRPTASQVVNMFEDIYFINLDIITEGLMDVTSQELMDNAVFADTNFPKKNKKND